MIFEETVMKTMGKYWENIGKILSLENHLKAKKQQQKSLQMIASELEGAQVYFGFF